MNYVLEACVDSVESAILAADAGADRLELCSNLVIGGTTPTPALFNKVRKLCDIKINVLVRPRFGDFYYTEYEFSVIRDEIKQFKDLGTDGIVIGILQKDGNLDVNKMEVLIKEADGIPITLHRAFDVCKDPYQCLEQACDLGIHTILTSGQKNSCLEGKECIKNLVEKSAGRIEIMAGSGVNARVINELLPYSKAPAYHLSGKTIIDSGMEYRKEGVSMGLKDISEFQIWRTEPEKIKEAKEVLKKYEGWTA